MVFENIARGHQQTRDSVGSNPNVIPIPKILSEKVKVWQEPLLIHDRDIDNSWIVGSSTNAIVGTHTGTIGGGQLVVGGTTNTETLRSIVAPKDQWVNFLRDTITNQEISLQGASVSDSQGPLSTAFFESRGSNEDWNNLSNLQSEDGNVAYSDSLGGEVATITDDTVQLVKLGQRTGDNKATGSTLTNTENPNTYTTYGGSSDLWGLSLTPSDINSSNFGVGLRYDRANSRFTNYLIAKNFGFSIPPEATITGVTVEVTQGQADVPLGAGGIGFATYGVVIDHIRMTVNYTQPGFDGGGVLVSQSAGVIDTSNNRLDLDSGESVQWILSYNNSSYSSVTPAWDTDSNRTNFVFSTEAGSGDTFTMTFPFELGGALSGVTLEISTDNGDSWTAVDNKTQFSFDDKSTNVRMRLTANEDGRFWKTTNANGREKPILMRLG